jgi:hypothetical protein
MLLCKMCSDRLLKIADGVSAFLQLKVDTKSSMLCHAPYIDPPFRPGAACILEN